MIVRFKCFGPLRRIIGTSVKEVEVPNNATVRDVILSIVVEGGNAVRRLIMDGESISGNLILMLNQIDVQTLKGEETTVHEGDIITLLPHVQGG